MLGNVEIWFPYFTMKAMELFWEEATWVISAR